MGWKKVKNHYGIKHLVSADDRGICIGSAYIHDILVISAEGEITKSHTFSNEDLERILAEMEADPQKLRDLILAADSFDKSITVYTYEGGNIIEKQCEEAGWPNVTHDGCTMYENTFSTDEEQVVAWAKRNADAGISLANDCIEDLKDRLDKAEERLQKCAEERKQLEANYPEFVKCSACDGLGTWHDGDHSHICQNCNGDGRVRVRPSA